MAKKRIVSILLSSMLITPLIEAETIQTPFEAKKVVDSDKKIDLRNYKLNEINGKLEVEFQKIKEIKQEEERLRQEELERQLEEQRKLEEEQNIANNRIYCKFEVSFYCGCYNCTQNGNLQTASGEYAVEGITIATPTDIPFGSQVYIEELGQTYIVQDRGGYIEYTYDEYGNLVMRLDVYVADHNVALEYGRFYSDGYIDIKN